MTVLGFEVRFLCTLLLLVNFNLSFVLAEKGTNSWSISLGNVHLFDIPKFQGFLDTISDTESSEKRSGFTNKNLINEVNIDPDVIEDSFLRTVCVFCVVL